MINVYLSIFKILDPCNVSIKYIIKSTVKQKHEIAQHFTFRFFFVLVHDIYSTFYTHALSQNSSQINACITRKGVLGPRFIVSSEGLGLHKMLLPMGSEPSSRGDSQLQHPACQTNAVALGCSMSAFFFSIKNT